MFVGECASNNLRPISALFQLDTALENPAKARENAQEQALTGITYGNA